MLTIITIDGPASSGKGTVAKLLAQRLKLHYLDSGAIYRVVALLASEANLHVDNQSDVERLIALIKHKHISCLDSQVTIDGKNVTNLIRDETVAMFASNIGQIAQIREALLELQRSYAIAPGLVTDGRDMGSVVFKQANLKVFLTANSEVRAKRRYKQLQQLGKSVTMSTVLRDIIARDERDYQRNVAPLSYDSSFVVIDNSDMTIDETVDKICNLRVTTGIAE